MTRSCVTISLVEEARGGPFVFWDGLEDGCRRAHELGFDAVEVFPPGPEAVDSGQLQSLLDEFQLQLAAVGTGGGWVRQRLVLTSADAQQRQQATAYVRSIIDLAGPFGASAIIGSMQGNADQDTDQETALGYLADAMNELAEHASQYNVPLIYEPLNRYETNLCCTIADGLALLDRLGDNHNALLLADLFHMNIEETDIATAIRSGGDRIGHIHFVDSNRRPATLGHMQYEPIAAAVRDIGYQGYISAEALAYPDSQAAARTTIEAYRKYFG